MSDRSAWLKDLNQEEVILEYYQIWLHEHLFMENLMYTRLER